MLRCQRGKTQCLHFKTFHSALFQISDASKELDVWTIFSCNGKLDEITSENKQDVIINKDPRLDALGMRMVVPWSKSPKELLDLPDCHSTDSAIYKEHRYKNGIAEGVQEIPTGNAVPLEYNMALINGGKSVFQDNWRFVEFCIQLQLTGPVLQ